MLREQAECNGASACAPGPNTSDAAHLLHYRPSSDDKEMSSIEQDLKKQILGRSKAEKAFRPWWDTLEDYLLNSLVLLGFLTLPTAYVTGNPVECVLHPRLWNTTEVWDPLGVGHIYQDEYEEENIGHQIGTVRITHWYVKRYCTEKFVSKFVFYFPYILLIVPLTLVLVDRIFIKTFAAGNKIKQFYELIVEDSLRREDVDTMSRENMKNLHELMQSFRFSNVCYWSYLSRTCIEIVLSISLFLIYWCWGMPNLEREIECDVHGIEHSCVLPNHTFYFYILAISSALLCVYIVCNLYNLVWIMCPQLGTMYRIIRKYQDHSAQAEGVKRPQGMGACSKMIGAGAHPSFFDTTAALVSASGVKNHDAFTRRPCISTENFLAVYFDRRHKDLKLLLNLLAETSGVPESFRILTLFDKKFQSLWKPQNLRFEEYETIVPASTTATGSTSSSSSSGTKIRSHSIIVRWNDAPIGHFLTQYDSSLSFEYTIDISPCPVNELGLKSVLYKKDSSRSSSVDGDILNQNHCSNQKRNSGSGRRHNAKDSGSNNVQQRNDESFHLLETGKNKSGDDDDVAGNFRYEVAFDNIVSDEPEYTVTISTELNGRTVTQMVEKFPVGSPQDGDEDAAAAAATNEGDDAAGENGGGGVVVKEKGPTTQQENPNSSSRAATLVFSESGASDKESGAAGSRAKRRGGGRETSSATATPHAATCTKT